MENELKNGPLVSVVTPCYNCSSYILKTYESISSQTYKNWEWIVVDDCSSDVTVEVLNQIAKNDARVRVFNNPQNSGPSVSRNTGLDNAAGKYIAFLDSDDLWLPRKLEIQVMEMEARNLDLTCHDYLFMSDSEQDIGLVKIPNIINWSRLKDYNPLATSFVMVKKDMLAKQRFDTTLRRRQDWIFWFELLKDNQTIKAEGLPHTLGKYRRGSTVSISNNKLKMAVIQWQLYRTYFKLSFLDASKSFVRYAVYGVSKHYFHSRSFKKNHDLASDNIFFLNK